MMSSAIPHIKQIPENIHLLENLEKLWLGGNQEIKTFPISFAKLIKSDG